jgi:hypothetical protein
MSELLHLDRALTPAERRKLKGRSSPVPNGHAARPGSGPEGETCGSCSHLYRNRMSKTYLKCSLMRARWTGGGATDVRARDPACLKWAAISPEPPADSGREG